MINRLPTAYLTLALAVTSVGFSAIFIKGSGAPGMVAALYRMAIATVIMAWPFYRQVRISGIPSFSNMKPALLCGLLLGVETLLWSSSVSLGGAITPTIIVNTSPLWVGIGSIIFFRTHLKTGFWIGCLIALLGTGITVSLDNHLEPVGLSSLLAFISSIIFAAFLLLAEQGRKHLDAISYYWIITTVACITILATNLLFGTELVKYTVKTYINFLGLALVPQVIGWFALTYSLGKLPASLVSPSLLMQPVITTLLAISILGEPLNLTQIAGGVIVIIGIFLVHSNLQTVVNHEIAQ